MSHHATDHHSTHHTDAATSHAGLISKEDRQMFMEMGMMAHNNVLPWEGHALFGQLLLVEPEEAYPRVGMAYCKIMGGQFAEAHQLLKNKVVTSSSLKDFALALRGLAFYLAKQPKELEQLFKEHEQPLEKNLPARNMFQNLITTL
ncbi:MAG: hypothetical protein FJ390_02240 [Verrucomicrobia bacterium]|nr:hypothetical protein [Verrucomicrobiota bacterium]